MRIRNETAAFTVRAKGNLQIARIAFMAWVGVFCAQTLAQAPLRFDVASIRRHPIVPEQGGRSGVLVSGNGITVSTLPLTNILSYAYRLRKYQIVGGPKWVGSLDEAFDIAAKADGETALTQDQAQRMLQALLSERFQLKLHREAKEMPAYLLVVAKNGPKLKAVAKEEVPAGGQGRIGMGPGNVVGRAATLSALTQALSQILDRPVLDKTGLGENYDFKLEYGQSNSAPPFGNGISVSDSASVFTALQEQLGLKLDSRRVPIETLVIDYVERPSEN